MTCLVKKQFTQTDPLPSMGSAYVYAYNSPLVYVDPSGLRGVSKFLLIDSGGCPSCAAQRGGSRTGGVAGSWNRAAYDDDSIRASAAYGLDPRLLFGIFTQETTGSWRQSAGANRFVPNALQNTFGPTNLTESTLSGLLRRDASLRGQLQGMAGQLGLFGGSAVTGADAVRVLIFHEVFKSGHESFAAYATASRLGELQRLVRERARLKGFKEARGAAIQSALGDSSAKSVYESALIGAAYNAQTTDLARNNSIDAKLEFLPDTTPALVNNSGRPNVYSNQYTSSYCSAGRYLGSPGLAC